MLGFVNEDYASVRCTCGSPVRQAGVSADFSFSYLLGQTNPKQLGESLRLDAFFDVVLMRVNTFLTDGMSAKTLDLSINYPVPFIHNDVT